MSIIADVLQSYRHPREVIRRKLDQGTREDRALAMVMAASGLNFVSQWPGLARAAHFGRLDAEAKGVPLDQVAGLDARIGGALLATVFLLPLLAYAVAAVSHVIAGYIGGKGTHYGARLALFWSLLAIVPLLLLHGLVAGFIGAGPAQFAIGFAVFAVFLYLWGSAMGEVER